MAFPIELAPFFVYSGRLYTDISRYLVPVSLGCLFVAAANAAAGAAAVAWKAHQNESRPAICMCIWWRWRWQWSGCVLSHFNVLNKNIIIASHVRTVSQLWSSYKLISLLPFPVWPSPLRVRVRPKSHRWGDLSRYNPTHTRARTGEDDKPAWWGQLNENGIGLNSSLTTCERTRRARTHRSSLGGMRWALEQH